jgi:tRNA dimethylallyltransferase
MRPTVAVGSGLNDFMLTDARISDCWFLTGPTASGKTGIGLPLARLLGAEIISLDSMAVYRGMDIGTAKPSPADRQAIPHHLLDLRDPNEEFNVSQYLQAARQAIDEIRARGREVLFVGGTPLYLKAALRGVFEGPPADEDFRRRVEAEVDEVGLAALHQRLMQVDPLSAARLHPHDKRRIIRALEVYRLTGRPISHLQLQFEEGRPASSCRVFQLSWPRAELHRRIDERVDEMFAAGFVDEVRTLLARYGGLGKTASQAVGYREVIEHRAGERGLSETVESVKARTRQFARRQETWFRSLSECRPVELKQGEDAEEIARRIFDSGRANESIEK